MQAYQLTPVPGRYMQQLPLLSCLGACPDAVAESQACWFCYLCCQRLGGAYHAQQQAGPCFHGWCPGDGPLAGHLLWDLASLTPGLATSDPCHLNQAFSCQRLSMDLRKCRPHFRFLGVSLSDSDIHNLGGSRDPTATNLKQGPRPGQLPGQLTCWLTLLACRRMSLQACEHAS